jgi:hypothetical protein
LNFILQSKFMVYYFLSSFFWFLFPLFKVIFLFNFTFQ